MIRSRPSFDRAYARLTGQQRDRVDAAILRLEGAFGRPHLHAGIGLRPFGGYFELRAGLDLRVLFVPYAGDLVLVTVGNHDQVRRFLKG